MPSNQGQILSLIFTTVFRLCILSSLDAPVRACLSGYTTIVNLLSDSLQGLHRFTCGANSVVDWWVQLLSFLVLNRCQDRRGHSCSSPH
jgi:hypothetical protein